MPVVLAIIAGGGTCGIDVVGCQIVTDADPAGNQSAMAGNRSAHPVAQLATKYARFFRMASMLC